MSTSIVFFPANLLHSCVFANHLRILCFLNCMRILFLYPSFCSKGGWTALHRAAYKGNDACVKLLLEDGANASERLPVSEALEL